jgi:UV DNA damage endonuclease
MQKLRLGLCCIFHDQPIKFRTTTATYIQKLREQNKDFESYLSQIILDNLMALEKAIIFCSNNHIGSFRINSQFLPVYTHPETHYDLRNLPESESIYAMLKKCKQLAAKQNIRLCMHPDQFVVLNSPQAKVVKSSIAELEYHAVLAELVGADVINIHAGGVYGNKPEALQRLKSVIPDLSPKVRDRLTLENDDKSYTPEDLLPLCTTLSIPLVYDVHHHRCLKDSLSIEMASQLCYETWNREPLFHISSPIEGWSGKQPSRHHDYIDIQDFPTCWFDLGPLTVEIEAKAKEVAIQNSVVNELGKEK